MALIMPGGLIPFFEELSKLPPGPPDLAVLAPLAQRYGVELVGPPL